MREAVLNFGPDGALVGVLTRPAEAEAARPVAMVFLNAGVLHRVGPNRIHVRLARRVVGDGVPSLRFDLPGIGDSRGIGGSGSVLEENLRAITIALDTLEGRDIAKRFLLFGLCSGADHAFVAACADPRVVGLVVVDPTGEYPTPRARAIRVFEWARRPEKWVRFFTGQYRVTAELRARLSPATGEKRRPPSEEKGRVEQLLRDLVIRRVRACYVMTGLGRPRYEYTRQLFDAFPGVGLEAFTRIARLPFANHTFPREESRRLLEDIVSDWLREVPFLNEASALPTGQEGSTPSHVPGEASADEPSGHLPRRGRSR